MCDPQYADQIQVLKSGPQPKQILIESASKSVNKKTGDFPNFLDHSEAKLRPERNGGNDLVPSDSCELQNGKSDHNSETVKVTEPRI